VSVLLLSDRRADISSRSGKQLQHTMENSTDSMSDLDYKSLVNQCLEMCSALKDKGCKFSLSLRLGSSFNFSLSSEGCSPPEATQKPRRSPSYLRRQTLRRAAFLQRKKKPPLAEETASTGNDNNVCRQEGSDLLDKKVASSGQTAQKEDETVDKDCPLNLNPTPPPPPPPPPPPAVPTRRLVTVTKDRASRSSFCQLDGESNDSSENVFDSEPNQVDENGKFKTTVPCDTCDRCRQPCHLPKKVSWVADSWCDPCFRELFGDYKPK